MSDVSEECPKASDTIFPLENKPTVGLASVEAQSEVVLARSRLLFAQSANKGEYVAPIRKEFP